MITLNFIAHPDDDFLLFNPDIAQDILNGHTVHLYYLTDGDDGHDAEYCTKKRNALYQTYSEQFPEGQFNLRFMGVRSNSFRNGDTLGDLYKMWHDHNYVAPMHPLGLYPMEKKWALGQIADFIRLYSPDLIRMHNPYSDGAYDHDDPTTDHLDHIYSAKFVMEATPKNIPLYAYVGYQIRHWKPNLSEADTALKKKLWRAYQSHEPEVAGEQWDLVMDKTYKIQVQ